MSNHLLFFFTVKLSIFSRLCVKHKGVMSRSTHTEIWKLYSFKKTVSDRYRYRQILRIFGIVSYLKKWYRVSPNEKQTGALLFLLEYDSKRVGVIIYSLLCSIKSTIITIIRKKTRILGSQCM